MKKLKDYINAFTEQRILVIGDLIADEFVIGQPSRLSREAPVLILNFQKREVLPGGGANAANNICSLGGKVNLVGVVGQDRAGNSLKNYLHLKGMNTEGIIFDSKKSTAVKTRILAGGDQVVKQQIIRIDRVDTSPIRTEIELNILNYLKRKIANVDGVLLSDYGLGLFTKGLRKEIIRITREYGKMIAVDTRYNLLDYQGVTIATPNLEEASFSLGRKILTQRDVISAGKELLNKLELNYLLITQGGDGMTLFTVDGENYHIPAANYTEVFDVTGAGDTVVGTLILALCSGMKIQQAMELSNYAAGIVVRKIGVATVSREELKGELLGNEKQNKEFN